MDLSNANEIELADKSLFNSYFNEYPPVISELTFTNLYIWRNYYDLQFFEFENHLVLFSNTFLPKWEYSIIEKPEGLMFLPPIGSNPEEIIIKIFQTYDDVEFHRIPNNIIDLLKNKKEFSDLKLKIQEDRKNWDYLYKREDLIRLSGNKYRSKRRFLEKFKEKYEYEFHIVNKDLIEKCRKLQNKWCIINECQKNEDLQEEQKAINNLFDNFSELDVIGGLILVDDKAAGYTFGEMLNNDTLVIHIEKAHTYYEGSYQAINNYFLKQCCQEEAEFINREQDLGVEGLRKAKKSYHPIKMIEKQKIYKAKN